LACFWFVTVGLIAFVSKIAEKLITFLHPTASPRVKGIFIILDVIIAAVPTMFWSDEIIEKSEPLTNMYFFKMSINIAFCTLLFLHTKFLWDYSTFDQAKRRTELTATS
jgi:hypothetical protein